MAQYVIGDIQGCLAEFQSLLTKLDFNPGTDTLWLTGDLVNRGPQSLATLRLVKQHDGCMQTILGNHDLHLLALHYGYGKLKRADTISDILNAPDRKELIDWLRQQPLYRQQADYVLVHAGIWPEWTCTQAQLLAQEVETVLQNTPQQFFAHMYGNKPDQWNNSLSGDERLRFITNSFTRMRALTDNGAMDFDYKGTLNDMPAHHLPWFEAPNRQNTDKTILFGHWSALGLYETNNVVCVDTGALWGGSLTAFNLDDRSVVQTPSQTKLNFENLMCKK
ncbi:symmetrical bis(5'-nucleosyl)-tetraphosphatase [Snodgrassella sp. ESL0253]|uniref:symmetrical bis(5'-nucleosyl)-tetraphosphatase n=1 Tax=Snodgrassella sp. ESL0253 TaxID=2705031 RepID=UPI00158152D3|nr:symmetrical bis(5'-nucleosyl)-tetraphosphatase [Snodgrassella sp. ESL0253]NUE66793.1 symmetrical bis(5'-nucleosyl)-tetraphosphatase [Snodgrassella sp. ESL0253]